MSEEHQEETEADITTAGSNGSLQTAISSSYKVLGEDTLSDGAGVLGRNKASSGTPIGVEGVVPNNTSDGFGLATPHDARIDGLIESSGSHTLSVDGTQTLELGPEDTDSGNRAGGGNVIGGYKNNGVQNGAVGASVGGGGNDGTSTVDGNSRDNFNAVTDDYGTVGGGYGNRASRRATVAGGGANTAGGSDATVGGGLLNTADSIATVGGGSRNEATALRATVGGGLNNEASGDQATVAGGYGNEATAKSATIAGGGNFDQPAPRNVVYDNYGAIGGGDGNQAGSDDGDPQDPTNAEYATVGGGNGNEASGEESTVGGGVGNIASGEESTVSGGDGNEAKSTSATVGGGVGNTASGGEGATVGGGVQNTANGSHTTVGGGRDNTADGLATTVPGGRRGAAESDFSFVWNDDSRYHSIPNSSLNGLSSDTAVDGESVTGGDTFSASAENGFRFITGGASSPSVVTLADDGSNAELTFHSDLPDENGTRIGINSAGKLVKSPSSARYKTDIQPLSTDTSRVLDLEPREFEYEDSGQPDTGLIAEEVEDELPELAHTDEQGRPEFVKYDRLGVYLIPEVDENRDRLEVTDERIDTIEAQIERKDDQITDLEAELERKDERIDALETENDRLQDRLAAIEAHLGLNEAADPAPADD